MSHVPFHGRYVWAEDSALIICPYCSNEHYIANEDTTCECGHTFRYITYAVEIINDIDVADSPAVY